MSTYVHMPPATYDVRVVAGGATDCSQPLLSGSDATNLAAWASDQSVLLVATGFSTGGNPSLKVHALSDELGGTPSQANLRFFNAAIGPASLDLGQIGAAVSLFKSVVFTKTAAPSGTIDEQGYLLTAPLQNANLYLRPHNANVDLFETLGFDAPGGSLSSLFAIGDFQNLNTPLDLVVCNDLTPPSNGLSACQLLTPVAAQLRVADLQDDSLLGGEDFCLSLVGASPVQTIGPLVQSLGVAGLSGLNYGDLSRYFSVPPGNYDLVVAAPGAVPPCGLLDGGTGLPLPQAVPPGTFSTAVVTGNLNDVSPNADALLFQDEPSSSAGTCNLRFIPLVEGASNLDFGEGTPDGGSFQSLFTDVPYGTIAAANDAGIDASGYLETPPLTDGTVSLLFSEDGGTLVTLSDDVNLPAGQPVTAFAFHQGGGVAIDFCADGPNSTDGGFSSCVSLSQ